MPKIEQPLDPTSYREKPCELLPPQLSQSLNYTNPGITTLNGVGAIVGGPACNWLMPGIGKEISVQLGLTNTDPSTPGLARTFALREKGRIAYAEPTEVSGYPAAFADVTDGRPAGRCALAVAVADSEVFAATAQGYQGAQESCDLAKQVAEAVIQTLKEGS